MFLLISPQALEQIWQSKSLLLLKPTNTLLALPAKCNKQLRWFWLFMKKDINLLTIAAALGIIIAALGLSTAIFSQNLIDKILPSKNVTKLYSGIALLLLLLLVKTAVAYLRQLLLLRQSRDMNIRLSDYFCTSLLFLPKSFFDSRKTGELLARLHDTRRIQQTISNIVGNVAVDILLIVVSMIALFNYHIGIGFFALLWLPVFVVIVRQFHHKIIFGQTEAMAAYAQNESNYINTMQGIHAIKANNCQLCFASSTKIIDGFSQQKNYVLGLLGLRFSIATEFFAVIFIAAITLGASLLVLKKAITAGAIIAILQMVSMLMGAAGRLATTNIQLQEAKIAFERMDEFTSIKPEFDKELDKEKLGITNFEEVRFENVTFRFAGRKKILENISFTLKKGKSLALIGEIGSGKSTTLQLLQKFYEKESGKIWVNGVDFSLLSVQHWRSIIGAMPQQIKLFNGTVLQNIVMGDAQVNPAQLISFLKYYEFDTYFERFPNGYATLLGEQGADISTGQAQLIGFARALWRNPQLLLLDEPTASLDSATEKFVLSVLDKVKETTAVLVLTHKTTVAEWADALCSLEGGILKTVDNLSDYNQSGVFI